MLVKRCENLKVIKGVAALPCDREAKRTVDGKPMCPRCAGNILRLRLGPLQPLVPPVTRLSDSMRRMLININDHHDALRGISGRGQHGAAQGTIRSLLRQKLVVRTLEGLRLTDAGREAIGLK